jgi:ring-1,2-phenylacetyl-CoA epoxidase subunit PaaD
MNVLREIPDPEMPISIVDLGLVEDVRLGGVGCDATSQMGPPVEIVLLPTFIGCPALDMIAGDVKSKVGDVAGIGNVAVKWVFDPPWSVDRITAAGRESLRAHGVTVPERGSSLPVGGHMMGRNGHAIVKLHTSAVACPFCASRSTTLESPFGPTRCRTIHYCEKCKNSFEHLKRV